MNDNDRDSLESPRRCRERLSRGTFIIILLIAAVGASLRISAARDEMWIDEIVSWHFARACSSVADVFFRIHSDNNHYLNTLWMYLIGDRRSWFWYRVPSIMFGSAATIAVAMLAVESADAMIAALLVAGSYFLIQYSSEVRGYAPAMFFAVLAFAALKRSLRHPSRVSRYIFGLCCILSLLFHLTFLYIYFALLLWSAVHLWRTDRRSAFRRMFALHVLPVAVILALYIVDIARMNYGGGPTLSHWRVTFNAAGWILGGNPAIGAVLFGVMLATLIFALVRLYRAGNDEWIFFAAATIVGPALLLIASRDPYVYARYFVLATPFYLLLLAHLLGACFRRGGFGRVACIVLLAAFLAGNARNTLASMRFGRGHYLEALQYIESQSGGKSFTVGSPHDGRNQLVVEFYQRYLHRPDALHYLAKDQWPATGPQWLIIDVLTDQPIKYPKRLQDYVFSAEFPHSGISGVTWLVYRKE